MSCIVAIQKGNKIVFGGDRAISDDNSVCKIDNPKVFGIDDELYGYVESIRFGKLLGSFKAPLCERTDVDDYINIDFVAALRSLLSNNGFLSEEESTDKTFGSMLFTFLGKLYVMEEDFGVWSPLPRDGIAIVSQGSGSEFALGALEAFCMSKPLKTKKDLETAALNSLRATAIHCPSVAGPFDIISL